MSAEAIALWAPFVGFTFALFFSLWALEALVAWRRGLRIYDLRDSLANLSVFIVFTFIAAIWTSIAVIPALSALGKYALWQIGPRFGDPATYTIGNFLLLFLVDDLCFYVFHRFSHRVQFFWAMHEAHHSSRFFNITVAGREPWTALLSFLFWAPVVYVGFDPSFVVIQHWLSLTYQQFIHTAVVGRMGLLEIFLNTPSHHRVHHGTQDKYLNRNFGGTLIIWDKLFSTFQPEEEKPDYGILPPLESHSPLAISFNGFARLMKGLGGRTELDADPLRFEPVDDRLADPVPGDDAEDGIHYERPADGERLRERVGQ